MSRINLLEKDTKKTTAEIRKEIGQLIKQANRVKFETEGSVINKANAQYFLRDFHINRRGGFSANYNYTHRGKKDIISMYNQLVGYINADTESKSYEEYYTRKEREIRNKFMKSMADKGILIDDRTIDEYIEIKEMFPELFENFEFYEQLLDVMGSDDGDGKQSMLQELNDIRRELKKEKGYTTPDAIRVAFLERHGKEYQ